MSTPGETIRVRFSLTCFAPRDCRLAVVGSCPQLGEWQSDRAQMMESRLGGGRLQSEPDFHWVDVELPEDVARQKTEYKFVEFGPGEVRWEELDANSNRLLHLDGEKAGDVYLLPVQKFGSEASESGHTASFYSGVKERGEISVRRVTSQIFIGSCPRSTSHIDYLKSLGVTAVSNFQSEEDCKKNCVAGIGMEENAHAVKREYERRGMKYLWMPTADMCSDGRTEMLPRASNCFAELLRGGHVIYSHCNAGVGRSVSAVCGYLTFVLGLTDRQMQHVVASSRPAAFFDFDALHRARPVYEAQFGGKASSAAFQAYEQHLTGPSTLANLQPGTAAVRFSILAPQELLEKHEELNIALVGSSAELGEWKIEGAVVMESRQGNGFYSIDVALPRDVLYQLEYKFVHLMGDAVKWEEFGVPRNRQLEPSCRKAGDLMLPPVAQFGVLFGDEKLLAEAMAVLDLCPEKTANSIDRL
mmetsp:Transcript_32049/g.51578  ORF Transcript_32049/g.51578 Transcript_32049/m.51578 type:complete len:472 (-) Transcript_32049:145-1560(-)